jgi:hypothetical protein
MFPPENRYETEKKSILEKSLPAEFHEKSHLKLIEVLRRIPLVPQEKTALNALEKIIGKPIPAISPFQNGNITQTNPLFDSTSPMYFAIDGHIINFRLDKCNLKEIPLEIAQFSELQFLNLNDNAISLIPNFLTELNELQILMLINNQISEFHESIWSCSNLKELMVAGNPITDIPRIKPNVEIPFVRINTLKNFLDENLIEFRKQIDSYMNNFNYWIDNDITIELVAVLCQIIKRFRWDIDEKVIRNFVYNRLGGL